MTSVAKRFLGLLIIAGAGCGSAVDPTFDPPIGTLHGLVTGEAKDLHHALRVALVWESVGGDRRYVVQETDIEPVFPARFRMDVKDPPPEAAMSESMVLVGDIPRPFRRGLGHFAVYEDLNDNGHFDLIPPGVARPIDRLLADSDNARIDITYYEGAPEVIAALDPNPIVDCFAAPCPTLEPHTVVPGFNVSRFNRGPDVGDECVATPCHMSGPIIHWYDPKGEIELPLSQPIASSLQCEDWEFEQRGTIGNDCPGNVAPAGWGIICWDGQGDFYSAISPHGSDIPVCTFSTLNCNVTWTSSDPLPADWPCR